MKTLLRPSLRLAPPLMAAFVISAAVVESQSAPVSLTTRAVSSDAATRRAAIQALRAQGPDGLQRLMQANAPLIEGRRSHPRAAASAQWQRVSAALDAVAAQRDAYAAGLYWYTDLGAAKVASRATGKPILSLRMLGRLDEDLSCANSRFFRTALYPNAQIASKLRDGWILHWSSERPVPIVSIDMGDGRVLKRTLTGNSAHYLLNSVGQPLDVLPGLYGPTAFARWLDRSAKLASEWKSVPVAERTVWLRVQHRQQLRTLADDYARDLAALNLRTNPQATRADYLRGSSPNSWWVGEVRIGNSGPPPAALAGARAMSKVMVEAPLLPGVTLDGVSSAPRSDIVDSFVPLHLEEAKLDESSLNLMRTKTAQVVQAQIMDAANASPPPPARLFSAAQTQLMNVPLSATRVASRVKPTVSVVNTFQEALARDTLRNEYRLHATIHRWFSAGEVQDFDSLNTRVYKDLFLTPRSDAWLGLVTPGIYAALDNDGIQKR